MLCITLKLRRQKFEVKGGTVAVKDDVSHTARAKSWRGDAREMNREADKLEKAGNRHEAGLLRAAAGWYKLGADLTPGA